MNLNSLIVGCLFFLLILNCIPQDSDDSAQWKAEVAAAEKAFNDMAREKGLVEAFTYFAADSAVIRRSRVIYKGKNAINEWYQNDTQPGDSLTWYPTFIDVSKSGDMAWTYGNFTFSYLDTLGNRQINEGIFHTVWQRQPDGSWKYVWD